MNLWEFIASLDLSGDIYRKKPNEQRGPVPVHPMWLENAFIIPFAMLPLLAHAAFNHVNPDHAAKALYAWPLYHLWFIVFTFTMLKRLHFYMNKYGCLDEQNRGRDLVDDRNVNHLGRSVFLFTVVRTIGVFAFSWRDGDLSNPLSGISWQTPIKVGVWQIVLDLFFYVSRK